MSPARPTTIATALILAGLLVGTWTGSTTITGSVLHAAAPALARCGRAAAPPTTGRAA